MNVNWPIRKGKDRQAKIIDSYNILPCQQSNLIKNFMKTVWIILVVPSRF